MPNKQTVKIKIKNYTQSNKKQCLSIKQKKNKNVLIELRSKLRHENAEIQKKLSYLSRFGHVRPRS